MKRFRIITILIASLALTACGIKNRSSNNDVSSNPSANIPSASVPTEHSAVSGAIGPSGGTVKDPEKNLTINIPSGALSSDTNITAQYIESPEILSNKISTDFLGAAEFGPDGTVFAKPVSVTINLNKTPKNTSLAVFCYSAQYDVWEYVTDATTNGNKATFEVTHFSKYQVMDRTRDFLNEYTNMVNHAQVNGLSDSEVIEAFRDYLVNEKHVMDQYTTYNGYWYEPCGLKINGQYQINGKSGDPEALSHREGESNKVGNAYGLSKIDGAISSKDKVKGASSNSEVYDITVIVEYKIITPDIELTASKKKLNKGESATINIRCHYTNVQNFYSEYKDLELANYMLTIAKPTNFTTDKSAVLTDSSGRASFVVTAKENNKAETITVSFDLAGDFGTHAEGNITLNSEGTSFFAHTEEELEFRYIYPDMEAEGGILVTEGLFKINVQYDIEGSFTENNGALNGDVSISNTQVTFANRDLHYYGYEEGQRADAYVNIFDHIGIVSATNPSLGISGSISDNICTIKANDTSTLSTVHGYLTMKESGPHGSGEDSIDVGNVVVRSGANMLLPFELTKEPQTNISNSVLDTIVFSNEYGEVDIRGYVSFLRNSLFLVDGSIIESTTQTFTIS